MKLNTRWCHHNKLLNYAAGFLALGSVSFFTSAEALDKSKIQFIGPLAENMQLKPFQSPYGSVIIDNLLPQLQQNVDSFSVFGKKTKLAGI